MTTVLAIVGGYFGLLFILSLLVRPKRERLAVLARELLSDVDILPQHAQLIQSILDSAYRLRSAPLQVLALIIALFIPSKRFDKEAHEWAKKNADIIFDPRWAEMFECHTASVAAANPIFGALVYVGIALFRLKAWIFFQRHLNKKLTTTDANFERKAVATFGRVRATT